MERSGHGLVQELSHHLLGGWKISDRTASILADIQTDHLLDTSLVHYCYNPLSHNMTYPPMSLLCVFNILSNVRISCYGQNDIKKQPSASVGWTATPIFRGSQVSQSRVGFLLFLQSALPREPLLQWLGETGTHTNHCQALSSTTNLWPKKVVETEPATNTCNYSKISSNVRCMSVHNGISLAWWLRNLTDVLSDLTSDI